MKPNYHFVIVVFVYLLMITASAQVNFIPLPPFSSGNNMSWMVVGDFNGDSRLDLATGGGGVITAFLNNGNNAFSFNGHLNTQGQGHGLLRADDIDKDGFTDLMQIDNSLGRLRMFLGSPTSNYITTGNFRQPPVDFTITTGGTSTFVGGNFFGDSKNEIIVASSSPVTASLNSIKLYQLGSAVSTWSQVQTRPELIVTGHFNSDNKLDFAFLDSGNTIKFFFGTGNPASPFTLSNIQIQALGINKLASGDFNNDGLTDILATGSNFVKVFLCSNTFQQSTTLNIPFLPISLSIADLDLDGKLDVALAGDMGVAVLQGQGNATFAAPSFINGINGLVAYEILLADIDNDGKPDLVCTNGNAISIFLNKPKQQQAITFAATQLKTYGDPDFIFNATSTSGNPVLFSSSNPSVINITGNAAKIIGAGTATITASSQGTMAFHPATDVTQQVVVSKKQAVVSLHDLIQESDGHPKSVSIKTDPCNLTVALTYTGAQAPPSENGTYTVIGLITDSNYFGQVQATMKVVKKAK
jgi:hypothetical protein